MVSRNGTSLLASGCLALTASVMAGSTEESLPAPGLNGHAQIQLANAPAPTGMFSRNGRLMRLYGPAFSRGATAEASVDAFLAVNADFLGVTPENLRDRDVLPMMYDRATSTYKFTRVTFAQYASDVPVFRGRIKLLVRNDPGFPLVLASTNLRDVRDGDVEVAPAGAPQTGRGLLAAAKMFPGLEFTDPQPIVWAGVDDDVVDPAMATTFMAESPDAGAAAPGYQKWLIVADAHTGAVLYAEDQVQDVDVAGSVSARVTQGLGADICGPEEPEALPYARVNIGAEVAFADENGDFVIPNAGTDPVTVESPVRGQYFRVFNQGSDDTVLSMEVTPPGPADFMHNDANDEEHVRAEANAYLHANIVRDFALSYIPNYPVIETQEEFTVNVNIASACNATYSGNAINFYHAAGGCPNMAYSSIVYHEYGHHLVASGGSGQSEYGEGMSDVTSILVQDDPGTGYGFFGDCEEPLRTAENDCQYLDFPLCSTCGAESHACGNLISGCVWATRNELVITEPDDYRDILITLALNSILVHEGRRITPAITIDYLTLDDDDENINNGTPHYDEIATGFGAHGMAPPPFRYIDFEYPDGRPELLNPSGTTTTRVNVVSFKEEPVSGTGTLHFDDGNGVVEYPLEEVETNEYVIHFPPSACPAEVTYYISAEAANGITQYSPLAAPDDRFTALVATGEDLAFDDDFEAEQGWTVVTDQNVSAGGWERGVPAGGDDGPDEDADGSGQCYVTGLAQGEDLDGAFTVLSSPVMDASNPEATLVVDIFMDNGDGTEGMIINGSDDGGQSFRTIQVYRPDPERGIDEGVWVHNEWRVADIAGLENTDQFVVQFRAGDQGTDHTHEVAIDGVKMRSDYSCEQCDGDVDGDADVDFDDLLAILSAYGGACDDCPEDLDDDDDVDFDDLLIVLSNYGPCE